jgi:type IV secretory pathway VirB10-like protein
MVDKDKDNFEGDDELEGSGKPDPNFRDRRKDFSPTEDESLPDDVPAVSVNKKKNVVIFAIGFVVIMYFVYSFLSSVSDKKANKIKTEVQEMQLENRKKSGVPDNGKKLKDDEISKSVSASAATPGAAEEAFAVPRKSNQISAQDTLPEPPTLPPVYDPASIYVKDESGGGSGSGISGSGGFGNRYTKQRSRLPEVESDISEDVALDDLDPESRKAIEDARKKKINASMFVGSSKPSGRTNAAGEVVDDQDGSDDGFILNETSAAKTDVTIRLDLESVILQGKVIDAVLETAINTDLPGKLRAIISRDVYSEDGKRVVIPKGSRLIGSYATDIKFNQARVYVIWSRVIRPDGVDAVLDSSDDMIAVDSLGRSGVYGELDNRFFEIFGSSILLSSLTVGFAVAADAALGGDNTTTTTTPSGLGAGTSTTSGDVVSQGVAQAIGSLGRDTANVAKQYFNTKPRITVDQGTRIKIFVNKDIIFPPSYFSSGMRKDGAQIIN